MMRKKRYLFFIPVVLLTLSVLTYTLANKLVHKKLISYLEDNKSDLPIKSYDNIKVNVWKGYLTINNVVLSKERDRDSFIKAKNITIEGLGLIKLWRNNEVAINHLEILEPEIYLINSKATPKNSIEKSEKNKELPKISIAETSIKDAVFSNQDDKGEMLTKFQLVEASFKNIKIEDWDAKDTWFRNLDSYNLEIKALSHKTSKWEVLEIEQILLSDKSYEIKNLHLQTELGVKEYNALLPHERDHYNVKLPQVTLSPAIWKMQDKRHRFSVSKINFATPTLEIYRDKLLPDDTSIKPLFSQLLRELHFDIQTEEIKIDKAAITYTERVKEENDGGSVQFSDFDAIITDAGNFKEVNKEKDLKIKIETTFMGSSKLTADWRFDPQSMEDAFHFQAKISHLDANRANEFTEPNLFVKMEGKIEQIYLNIYGNRNVSETDFAISYHELKINLLRHDGKKRRKLISAIANIFVRRDSKAEEEKLHEEKVEVERDKTKSIFNFLWKNTLEGLKATTYKLYK